MILTSYFSSGRIVKCGGTRRTDYNVNEDFYLDCHLYIPIIIIIILFIDNDDYEDFYHDDQHVCH